MKPPHALLFDLDDTLIDEREHRRAVMQTCSTLASLQDGLDADRLFVANQKVWRTYWPEAEGNWMLGVLDGASLSLEAWRRTLRAVAASTSPLRSAPWRLSPVMPARHTVCTRTCLSSSVC